MKIDVNHEAEDQIPGPTGGRPKNIEWKWITLGAALLAVVIVLALNHKPQTELPTGTISFKGADVVLLPGPGWTTISSGGFTHVKDICLPVLQGVAQFKGCMIEVIAPSDAPSDPAVLAKSLAASLLRDPNVITNSVQANSFTTASGLPGIRISAHIKVKDMDREGESVACAYIVVNASGRCIRINFTSLANPEGAAADEMIRRTLALR